MPGTAPADGTIRTRPLERSDWAVIERLFGTSGACGGCWCMWWRVPMGGRTWEAAKGAPNRKAFRRKVESGQASGVLAFRGEEPVGWCAAGPRSDFPRLERSRGLARPWGPGTWSLNCLFVPARHRGAGVGRALVGAAVDLARDRGATELEAYPQILRRGERQAGAFVWTGVPALFEPLGFVPVNKPERGRALYLLSFQAQPIAALQHGSP